MKRTTQMKNAGVPNRRAKCKFKGFRDKQPTYAATPIHMGPGQVKGATAAFALGGSEEAIRFLGARAKFAQLAPLIKERMKIWIRAARHIKEVTG